MLKIKESKPHYEILDGLRGVAALVVVLFHIFEIHSEGDHSKQIINHGYLAVDFFFLLSGFVVAYAYDDRWGKMSLKDFFKRRLVRLQPMIVVGSIVGAAAFYFQDSAPLNWNVFDVSVWQVLLLMVIGATLFPVGKGLDFRGWGEMHPLNGPAWTLFFEYIANILYALVLRHLSKIVLTICVLVAAFFTVEHLLTAPKGDIVGGWSISDPLQIKLGFIRLAYPFLCGMLLARVAKIKFINNAFLYTSLMLIVLLAMPRIGVADQPWMNGLYEAFCILVMFPIIVWMGAGGEVKGKKGSMICKFLGDISYPVYITHYPIVYIYMAFVTRNDYKLADSWPYAIITFVGIVVVAYLLMKFYDLPIREKLRKRFL